MLVHAALLTACITELFVPMCPEPCPGSLTDLIMRTTATKPADGSMDWGKYSEKSHDTLAGDSHSDNAVSASQTKSNVCD